MDTSNTHLLRIAEIDGRLRAALLNGETTIRIRSELAQARRDHADADEADRNATADAEARHAKLIGEHATVIADQVIETLNHRLAELEAPASI
jgi:hypothetical protein